MAREGPLLQVWGVLNVTPDSFSDGGLSRDREAAVARGLALAEAGADVIDVGGESTRPGAPPVPAEEEAERVVPVITALSRAGVRIPSAWTRGRRPSPAPRSAPGRRS